MKLFFISILSLFFMSFLFAKENQGPVLYSSCKFCHGLKAEKTYANEVPSIQRLDEDALITMLLAYKKGQLETYGYGAIMKMQMKNIPESLIPTLAKHIKGLK